MEIKIGDLMSPKIQSFLKDHLEDMARHSPPESIHALNLEGLVKPEITFWSIWDKGELMGCGALKELDSRHGEIKSMRTAPAHRGKGAATLMLNHIEEE